MHIEPRLEWGARVRGDFQYDANLVSEELDDSDNENDKKTKSDASQVSTKPDEKSAEGEVQDAEKIVESAPFALRDIDISVPRGV